MSEPQTEKYARTEIERISRLSPEVLCVSLRVPEGFSWAPGQHLGVTNAADGKLSYYSIASVQLDGDSSIELAMHEPSIKWPGPLQSGDRLYLSPASGGPPFDALVAARHVALIGMGTGVAPLRAVTQALAHRRASQGEAPRVTLLHGARDRENCVFFEELSQFSEPGFVYAPVLSRLETTDDWSGRVGRVQSHLADLPTVDAFFCVCGKLPMVSEVVHLLSERGVAGERIFSEGY